MTLIADFRSPADADGFVQTGGVEMCRISRYDEIPPFLMSVTSDSDLWMYVSSTGGLTAGRISEEQSLFPYETEDRLHHLYGITGPITLLRIQLASGEEVFWEPFSPWRRQAAMRRNLYKSALGNRLVFEEIHTELGLTFRYGWSTSGQLGFVRSATLHCDNGRDPMRVELLDGLLNLLPAGVSLALQQTFSCLTDAYKRAEWDAATGLAIYSLTSRITDRAEPAEALSATTVWSRGLDDALVFLSEQARGVFMDGQPPQPSAVVTGRRGAFLLGAAFSLDGGQHRSWDIVADVEQDHIRIAHTRKLLRQQPKTREWITKEIDASERGLRRLVAAADGLQCSGDRISTAHHAANVLFNCMRGGLPMHQYSISAADFEKFVLARNKLVHQQHQDFFRQPPLTLTLMEWVAETERHGIADLTRLAREYLPLTFGRRHGDPSRPWNRFAIQRSVGYEGNWRDIFQNWEAMAVSFPALIESLIAKFVNASTLDGFNPYRINSEGIEWEVHEPSHPWSNIGYWGDHQIVYLLKLLELSRQFHPGVLESLLTRAVFSYANVPYRLRPYRAIVQNPRETIVFDHAAAKRVDQAVRAMGADGKLLLDADEKVCHVTLLEKLLVPLLSKLCSFVPGGGIWMNTQRPEWNDANNALAGHGLSVVTLCHLRRYIKFLMDLLRPLADREARVSAQVVDWVSDVLHVLRDHRLMLETSSVTADPRRKIMDDLGGAFDAYRRAAYDADFSCKREIAVAECVELLVLANAYVDHSLRLSRRPDGLYHAYNLLDPRSAQVSHLGLMLEGQVAALSSGILSPQAALDLLEGLFESELFRADQRSFMLYPRRELPGFMDKNRVPEKAVLSNPLLAALVCKDADGVFRFSGEFRNVNDVRRALEKLAHEPRWKNLAASQAQAAMDCFEEVFEHRSFTGRSGAMYAYEGIGSIYWHMVAKLLLAAQECFWRAVDEQRPKPGLDALARLYYRIRDGLGFNKTATEYGAFPIDPYSHTPDGSGARQPGMTGQVKEEILTRLGEWGLRVRDGQICFDPRLLRRTELLNEAATFNYIGLDGQPAELALAAGSAAFTFCQVPIIYRLGGDGINITIHPTTGGPVRVAEARLDSGLSAAIFERRGHVTSIEVEIQGLRTED
jgi:hypothetical protein